MTVERLRWRRPLLIVHIAASAGLIGTALVLVALGVSGVRGTDPRTVYPAAHLMEVWVAAPLAVIALGTGVLQATLSGWGLIRHWWITVKLASTAGFTVVIFLVIIPRLSAVAADAVAGNAFTTAERLPLAVVPAAATALLVVNVALGVLKPSRTRVPT
ncbi:MAG: hypothetical protein GEV28_19055 [Actinophytocola sp.]|uniref:hypothetical protein n=1 Tax=Actinophytocola sp. TaxID=1872138 RepID=UPI00132B8C75|nr:hypothetical protein [Actinophytocola sp.]MPZ82378.1 hypothetical protein [Actinophytocola sp.]